MAPTPAVICYQHSEYQEVDLSTPWLVELAEREQREIVIGPQLVQLEMMREVPCEYRLEDCPATELLEYAWVFESEVPFECEAPPPRYLIIRGLEYAWYCVDRYNTDIPAWILQDRQAKGDKTDNWRTDSPGEMEQFIRTGERDGATSGLYPGVTFGDTFGDTHGLHSATWPPRRRPVRTEAELELLEQILKESEESSGSDESDGANESSASRSHS